MRTDTLRKINEILVGGNGYTDTSALLAVGFTNRNISELVELGVLEKIAHGRYWMVHTETHKRKDYKAVEVGMVNPEAIICTDSACYYHGLIDVEPEILSIATKRTDRHKMEMNFRVKRHYFSEKTFDEDYSIRTTNQGNYKIYNVERSVCDCIRFRDDIEKDIFELVIYNYKKREEKQLERLKAYARRMRVEKKVEDVLYGK